MGKPETPQSWNRYSYALNNPIKFADPDGEVALGIGVKLVKPAIKGGGLASTVAGIAADARTLASSDASLGDRVLAAASIASEIVSPVSIKEARGIGQAVGAASDVPSPGNLLDTARDARDTLAGAVSRPAKGRPAAVTAGFNTRTGEVSAQCSGGGICAEKRVAEALGGNPEEIQFTEAVRPRPNGPPFKEVPVCPACESEFGRERFPKGTQFSTDTE